ncbi:hypothetical protein JW968_01670 [Candidatus Woesearchaeota archaeon]|nr:hypothetical protein [Candidatus Woesearchaeota archaeon]
MNNKIIIYSLISMILLSTAAGLVMQNLRINNCRAQQAAASAGTWGTVCDNTYPGTALFYDDTTYEVHQVRKQGSGYWAGLRINSTNTSVTDCSEITKVMLCYKWWSATAEIQTCDISVDADHGASYTAVTTTCPGTTEPGAMTCTDVTSLESWTCSNFFASDAALAKSELVHSGAGANGYFDITWDVLYFNVTYNVTVTPVLSFTITLPGQSPVLSNTSAPYPTTGVMFFNATGYNSPNTVPCVGESTDCQNDTLPFFQFQNTGSIALNWSLYLNASMPANIVLKGDTDNDPTGATTITTTPWITYSNIATSETRDVWMWVDFNGVTVSDTTNRTLTHKT